MKFVAAVASCFLSALLVAGCGFRPLYYDVSTMSGGESVLDNVSISSIAGSTGQQLKNELIDRFYNNGYPENPQYVLSIELKEATRDIVIQKDDVTSRAQIVMIINYVLLEKETRKILGKGAERSVGSYNILGSQYANIVTRDKARDLALKELADKMALRVAVMLTDK